MQQDIGPVLVSVCGLLCVGGGLVAVVAFLVLKATGSTLLNAFDDIGGVAAALGIGEASAEADDVNVPARKPGGRRNLRARAEALDFDSAVSRQAVQPPPSSVPRSPASSGGTPVYPAQSTPSASPAGLTPAPPSPFDDDSQPALRPRRFRRDRTDDSDDDPDMLAGLMGEE